MRTEALIKLMYCTFSISLHETNEDFLYNYQHYNYFHYNNMNKNENLSEITR